LARIELSKNAFFHNLSFLSQKLGVKEKLAIVLKDNAYGHGLLPMAQLSAEFGLQTAIVRTFHEAEQIKTLFSKIIILNPVAPFISNERYSLTINNLAQFTSLPNGVNIELKVDTGMHRNGIAHHELHEAFQMIKNKKLTLSGVMTHFRSADELSSELFWQLQKWREVKQDVALLCKKHQIPPPSFHSANSAAALRLNHYEDDFARCGIATYGYHQMPDIFGSFDLKPVLKLIAQKITTVSLKEGERLGYGGRFTASHDMRVSTYDIGYGDGFFRFDGNGTFTPDGKRILGKISMDSFSLEGESEEVSIIGDAKEIADFFGTISYDVLVKLQPHIPRIIMKG